MASILVYDFPFSLCPFGASDPYFVRFLYPVPSPVAVSEWSCGLSVLGLQPPQKACSSPQLFGLTCSARLRALDG